MVEVKPCDRERFASVYEEKAPSYAREIRDGELDDASLLKAFAAHREAAIAPLVEVGQFLADRLAEFENELEGGENARQFFGHIVPALARFRMALGVNGK